MRRLSQLCGADMPVPNTSQTLQWERSKKLSSALNLKVNALALRADFISKAVSISNNYGLNFPEGKKYILEVQDLIKRDQKMQSTIAAVMTGKLGLRESDSTPGDLDVMAPEGTNQDQLVDYYQMGAIVWIVIGIVIVYGLVTTLLREHEVANQTRYKYKPLHIKATKLLCSDPNSPQCAEWKAANKSADAELKKSDILRLEERARELLGNISSGSKIGAIIAVPLIAWILMRWLKG